MMPQRSLPQAQAQKTQAQNFLPFGRPSRVPAWKYGAGSVSYVPQSPKAVHCEPPRPSPTPVLDAKQETVEELVQRFKETFRTNTNMEITHFQNVTYGSSTSRKRGQSHTREDVGKPSWSERQGEVEESSMGPGKEAYPHPPRLKSLWRCCPIWPDALNNGPVLAFPPWCIRQQINLESRKRLEMRWGGECVCEYQDNFASF
ncbi:hypothetical protein P4O66_002788 [Electrophorus voltai]|uniref:Uncharacterized protein n=1 Tax=Electrophorus voltai TaxID=2609070 RepID=A0AAD9DPM6_9TELE|nr:hypothetical protein P4O66_002788 [Electrophorus voltai]